MGMIKPFKALLCIFFVAAGSLVFVGHALASDDSNDLGLLFDGQEFMVEESGSPAGSVFGSPLLAQAATDLPEMGGSSVSATKSEYTPAQINEMINNPLGELWMLFVQNDTTWYDGDALDFLGEDKKVFNTTTLMPVMPFQLTENVKWIFRPVVPIHY